MNPSSISGAVQRKLCSRFRENDGGLEGGNDGGLRVMGDGLLAWR